MDGSYLLDTNIVIRLFAGDKRVVHFLNEFSNAYVPCIVLGELFYGAQKSLNIEKNTAKIQEFAYSAVILPCDTDTSYIYGTVKASLKAQGRPIPENDIWIAALAKQHNMNLVTNDSHFNDIDGLDLLNL